MNYYSLIISIHIQPRSLQQLLQYLVGQPLRLQDFDVRASGEQRLLKVA